MWLVFALITTMAWGAADLFYKKGAEPTDRYSHLKTSIMVGIVMGLHALAYMLINRISFDPFNLILYFPVSFLYILSMTVGYLGLRYIELSISSPIQNSSGAVTAILIFLFFGTRISVLETSSIVIITLGILGLAILERYYDKSAQALAPAERKKYSTGLFAILFPLLYCIIDGLGTFADAIYLDEMVLISEDQALLAYEFTFAIAALVCYLFLRAKKVSFNPFREKDKGIAALFETAGQFFYVFAMSDNSIIAAPLIASYSMVSVLLSRIFLKEKLRRAQYAAVTAVLIGILMLAISEYL